MQPNYQSISQAPPPPYSVEDEIRPAEPRATSPLLSAIPDDFKYGVSVASADIEIRMAFVRKVYAILSLQLLVTVAGSAVILLNEDIKTWVLQSVWVLLGAVIGSLASLILAIYKQHSHPTNLIALSVFTLFETYAIGATVALYDAMVVLQALLVTLGVFIMLSVYALQTKRDFSGLAPYLYTSLWVIILASLVSIFLPYNRTLDIGIAVVTALVFSGYIIWDTQQVMHHLSCDDYIEATLQLYLDFLNLFLAILRILGEIDNN